MVLPEIMRTSHILTFIPLRREARQVLTSKQNMVMSVMSSNLLNLLFKSFRIGGFGDFRNLVFLGDFEPRPKFQAVPRDHFIRTRSDQVRDGCWRCTPQWVQVIWSREKPSQHDVLGDGWRWGCVITSVSDFLGVEIRKLKKDLECGAVCKEFLHSSSHGVEMMHRLWSNDQSIHQSVDISIFLFSFLPICLPTCLLCHVAAIPSLPQAAAYLSTS